MWTRLEFILMSEDDRIYLWDFSHSHDLVSFNFRYNDDLEEIFSFQRIPIVDLEKIEVGEYYYLYAC